MVWFSKVERVLIGAAVATATSVSDAVSVTGDARVMFAYPCERFSKACCSLWREGAYESRQDSEREQESSIGRSEDSGRRSERAGSSSSSSSRVGRHGGQTGSSATEPTRRSICSLHQANAQVFEI